MDEDKRIDEEILQTAIQDIFEEFGGSDELGIGSIFQTLALPEREFALLSEIILNEQEKALNNIEDKMEMVQALNASGIKVEDLTSLFTDLTKELEEAFADKMSQQKIDFLKRFMGIIIEAINATEGIAKRTVPVGISYCHEDAKQPKYANAGDAGMDIYAVEDEVILPGETKIIPTGIKVALPLGYELQVRPRSGLSAKTKLRIANCVGTIDANYRDEIKIIIENIEPEIKSLDFFRTYDSDGNIIDIEPLIERGRDFVIEKGQRIAQLVLSEKPYCLFYEVEDVKEIGQDRAGGFGSTGDF